MPKNAKKAEPIDRALSRLEKGRKRLASEQGMIARANARKEILAAMRETRRVLDRDFPNIAKKQKPRRKRTKIRDGYVPFVAAEFGTADYTTFLTWMAEAKISIQVVRRSTSSSVDAGTYVPEWAIAICKNFGGHRGRAPSNLKRAKKDRTFREVELAAYKLRQDQQ